MDSRGTEKKDRLLSALEKGLVMIHLDARRPGVLVPPHLKQEAHLRLNLSYRFDPPDLAVSDWGIRSTLSFSGNRFQTAVPWSALFAITSHVGQEFWLYPEDMPPELVEQAKVTSKVPVEQLGRPPIPAPAAVPQRGGLRQLDGGLTEPDAQQPPEPPEDPPPPRGRGHLRLVK